MPYETGAFNEVKAQLYDNIIFATKNFGYLAGDPSASSIKSNTELKVQIERCDVLLHNLQVDLLHVYFLTKFWREFSRLQHFRVHAARHGY